jgi:AraC family transcriptional regulator of arabinose operon
MVAEGSPGEEHRDSGIAKDVRVERSLFTIEAELTNPHLTTTILAAKLRISTSCLRQLFAANVGVGPGRLIHLLRLSRARSLLEDSPLSIKEVMAAVGFNDPSHFSRDFKKQFGVSPRMYRERHQAADYVVKGD